MTALAYRVGGTPGAGTPLVLLHGLTADASAWQTVTPLLADLGRVYAPDLPGHGDSPKPGTYSVELMRDSVIGLLDEVGHDRAVLIGHSLGGVVAYLVAQARPERVAALVLEETPPPVPLHRPAAVPPDEPTPYDWAVVPAIRAQITEPDPAWWPRLAEITVPVLVVAGGPASHVPQDTIAAMAARLPRGELVTIPSGHSVHEARPVEFADAVRRFLAAPGQPTSTAVTG